MSSPFSSALAELDGSLQALYSQLDVLGACLEVDDDRLARSLRDARQQAVLLRNLVRTQRPNAQWTDRQALAQLIRELETEIVAKAKRNQKRRDKLQDLALELEAGIVKHRFDSRSTVLNSLRLEAVEELRAVAVSSDVKELPGPRASEWLHWVLRLHETKDASLIAVLRKDFPRLESFANEMEEGYWVPAQRKEQLPAQSPEPTTGPKATAPRTIPSPSTESSDRVVGGRGETPQSVGIEFYKTAYTANYDQSRSLPYSRRSLATGTAPKASSPREAPTQHQDAADTIQNDAALFAAIASAPHVKRCDNCGGTFPAQFDVCPFDQSALCLIAESEPVTAAVESPSVPEKREEETAGTPPTTAAPDRSPQSLAPISSPRPDPGRDTAEAEVERLKALLVPQQEGSKNSGFQLLSEGVPRPKLVIACGVAGVVVVGLLIVTANSFIGLTASKLRSSIASARKELAHIAGHQVITDADIQENVQQKLAPLKDSSIQASVEDGVVTLTGQTPTQWQSVRAESTALQVPGVKQVKNLVQVQPDDAGTTTPAGAANGISAGTTVSASNSVPLRSPNTTSTTGSISALKPPHSKAKK